MSTTSHRDKIISNVIQLIPDVTFHACLMAAIQQADSDNQAALVGVFPDVVRETFIRDHAPNATVSLEEWLEVYASDGKLAESTKAHLAERFDRIDQKVDRQLKEIAGLADKDPELDRFEVVSYEMIRPQDIPDNWIVFNAHRPLAGTLKAAGGGTSWEDVRGPNGYHFAAVDPDNSDGSTDTWVRMNKADGAVIVKYLALTQKWLADKDPDLDR